MRRALITGNQAAAWGARLARADYVPAFPITPQTEIIETLASWIDKGEMDCRMTMMESEHSMITAAGAAAATGVRVFTATSSQGLLYAMEMLFTVAGWRAPFVLVNVSRGLSAPITLEPDHNDVLAARDSGFLQIHCSTCQEVVDSVLIGYRVAEDERVRLPLIVNLDGFHLSFTREPVVLPDHADAVDRVPAGLRGERARVSLASASLYQPGRRWFSGRSALLVLPLRDASRGAATAFGVRRGSRPTSPSRFGRSLSSGRCNYRGRRCRRTCCS
jgi:pyruvate/2-oxoacid:ferredoxin oxidoreductase alpha subunit